MCDRSGVITALAKITSDNSKEIDYVARVMGSNALVKAREYGSIVIAGTFY